MKRIIIVIFIFFSVSCSKDLDSLNVDVKNATTASGESFFTFGVKNLFDVMGAAAYPASTPLSMSQLWAQHVTAVTYTNISQYYYSATWTEIYVKVLKNLKESALVTSEMVPVGTAETIRKENMLAITEIMQVQAYALLVETFGDIPYSEALDYNNVLPKYDKGDVVYADLINRLNAAILKLNTSGTSFVTGDPIYNGNVDKWKKFANSLKLKMGMRIIDSDNALGTATVIEAMPGAFTSNADNAKMSYLSATPNTNPLWLNLVEGNRKDIVIAQPFVDTLNVRNDPRRSIFFTQKNGRFVGAENGQVVLFDDYSNYGTMFRDPALPEILMDYSAVEFLKAEAAERSIVGAPANAETHYNNAIRASFDYYGIGSSAETYLAGPNVNYSSAAGTWKQKIGVQKWIALFKQGPEAWTEYRRLDYPVLHAPEGSFINTVPVRSTYPISEQTLNGANYEAASAAIGQDLLNTKLFWDKF